MRLSVLRERLVEAFGAQAQPFAADHVLASLDGRTVEEALSAGVSAREVWGGVWAEMHLPARLR